MNYEIIESLWYTSFTGIIGVVAIKSCKDTWKAYIGVTHGFHEGLDQQHIAGFGTKLNSRIAAAYFPDLDIKNYGK